MAVIALAVRPASPNKTIGTALKAFQSTGIAGLALRSDNRAVPIVLLGLAGLTASAITAIYQRWRFVALGLGILLGRI